MEPRESPALNTRREPTLAGLVSATPISAGTHRKRANLTDIDDDTQAKKLCIRSEATKPPCNNAITFTRLDIFTPSLALSDLTGITRELAANRSVAIATGFMTPIQLSQLDPIGAAKAAMGPCERRWWIKLQNDITTLGLPVIDWTTSKSTVVPASEKRLRRRANALSMLYPKDVVDSENAMWFTLNHEVFRPLVKVVNRMQAAMRITVLSPQETYGAMVKVEIACLRHVISTATDALVGSISMFEGQAVGLVSAVGGMHGRRKKAHLAASGRVPHHPLYNTGELGSLSRIVGGFTDVLKRRASEMVGRSDGKAEEIMAIWDKVEELEAKLRVR